MTIESKVAPEGETAQSVLARQNLQVIEAPELDASVALELDAVRAAADAAYRPIDPPLIANQPQTQYVQPMEQYVAQIQPVMNTTQPELQAVNANQPLPTNQPPSAEIYPPFFKTIDIRIADGRTITVGPPEIPHMLVLPKMFANQGERPNVEIQSEMMLAKTIQYVRVFNGRSTGRAIFDYQQMIGIVHELGEVGLKAVMDAVALYWPDAGPVLWTELKKNLP